MDSLKLIPQVFFDLIGRVVPGAVGIVAYLLLTKSTWAALMTQVIGDAPLVGLCSPVAILAFLSASYVVGQLISPAAKLVQRVGEWKCFHPKSKEEGAYDWLRLNKPEAGAHCAKIRAEFTMHNGLAVVLLLTSVLYPIFHHEWRWSVLGALGVGAIITAIRGRTTRDTFHETVKKLRAAADDKPPDYVTEEEEMPREPEQPEEKLEAMDDGKETDATLAPKATVYAAFLQLAAHGQDNKSTTLYNFLVFNSILLLAWATIFAALKDLPGAVAGTLLCVVGIFSARVWEPLGRDYAEASDLYSKTVGNYEMFLPRALFPTDMPKPLTGREKQRRDKTAGTKFKLWLITFSGIGLRDLLLWIPRALAWSYVGLAGVTWWAWLCGRARR